MEKYTNNKEEEIDQSDEEKKKDCNELSMDDCIGRNTPHEYGKCISYIEYNRESLVWLYDRFEFSLTCQRAASILLVYILYSDIKIFKDGKEIFLNENFYDVIRNYWYKECREIFIRILTVGKYAYVKVKEEKINDLVPCSIDINDGWFFKIHNMNTKKNITKWKWDEKNDSSKNIHNKNNVLFYDDESKVVDIFPCLNRKDNLRSFLDNEIPESDLSLPFRYKLKPITRLFKYLSDENKIRIEKNKELNNPTLIFQNRLPANDDEMKIMYEIYSQQSLETMTMNIDKFAGDTSYRKDKKDETIASVYKELNDDEDDCINISKNSRDILDKEVNENNNTNNDYRKAYVNTFNDGIGVKNEPLEVGKNRLIIVPPFQEFKQVLSSESNFIHTLELENFVESSCTKILGIPENINVNREITNMQLESESKVWEKAADDLKQIMEPIVGEMLTDFYVDEGLDTKLTMQFQTNSELSMETLLNLYHENFISKDYMQVLVNREIDSGFLHESKMRNVDESENENIITNKKGDIDKKEEKEIDKEFNKEDESQFNKDKKEDVGKVNKKGEVINKKNKKKEKK